MKAIISNSEERIYIYKIHSSRLRRAKWNLTLPLKEARDNDEIVALSSSQAIRFIDEITGKRNRFEEYSKVRADIKYAKRQEDSLVKRREIKRLYEKLDEISFMADYLCVVMDKEKDYRRLCRGFSVNGINFVRLLGTNGGVKTSTIVFVSERVAPELKRRIENNRNPNKEMIPAKLEAYKALVCSGSAPVSMPKGIAVVDDCITYFKSDVVHLSNSSESIIENNEHAVGEPSMIFEADAEISLNESDGYGLMLPSLAERWSQELGLDYLVSGVNTRFAWEKGMVFTFDFLDFADNIAHSRIIKDAWGQEIDLSEVELILTTSMVKLWNSYESCEQYLESSLNNHYTFGITKTCPKELEKRRDLNYQFIQSYELTDEQIRELIQPTIDEIHRIIGGNWADAVLYLKGEELSESNVVKQPLDWTTALMVDKRMIDDPYVRKKIHQLIHKRITDAKIGILRVHGNYSIISGDPYSLCQSIFGLPVTGILKAGEIYNKYWADVGAEYVACFRAPMTCHNNILKRRPATSDDVLYWYRYMNTCTILNSWDTAAHALNGADKDGDLIMLTDNNVLVSALKELPALVCAQNNATKCIPTEEDFIQSNINSFGDDIGKITNRITSMFDIMAQYPKSSVEYQTLDYRIKCGQLFQQDAIDKAKGIIAKPMPKSWYDKRAAYEINDNGLSARIVADRKPYFMRYIYPKLLKQYNTYIKNTNKKCLREFRQTVDELLQKPLADLNEEERTFIDFYYKLMPVSTNNCVMNRICKMIEAEFDGYVSKKISNTEFDYTIYKKGIEYSDSQYKKIYQIYQNYLKKTAAYASYCKSKRVEYSEAMDNYQNIRNQFQAECFVVCANVEKLCDILIDLCYQKECSKNFIWDIAGKQIVLNLLSHNKNIINYPVKCAEGEIEYNGNRFTIESTNKLNTDIYRKGVSA